MRYSITISLLLCLVIVTTACQSEPPTPYPTYTPYPTFTPYPTYTPEPVSNRDRLPSEVVEDLVWPTGSRDDVIPVEDAADFIDETITVEGTIVRTHNSGKVVFLNFSEDYSNGFTAVIFADDWVKFPVAPENLFYGKLVRVEGIVQEYEGSPEIIIKEPWQIEVALTLGQPIISECDCPSPQPTATQTPLSDETPLPTETPFVETPAPTAATLDQVIDWSQAANFVGQTATVEGSVVDTYNSGKVIFLNFDHDYHNSFKVVIFPDAWTLFPDTPDVYYKDKTVRVTGQVKSYENSPEIIVDHPDQIEIME